MATYELALPVDTARRLSGQRPPTRFAAACPASLATSLVACAQARAVELSHLLAGIFGILLHRFTQEHVVHFAVSDRRADPPWTVPLALAMAPRHSVSDLIMQGLVPALLAARAATPVGLPRQPAHAPAASVVISAQASQELYPHAQPENASGGSVGGELLFGLKFGPDNWSFEWLAPTGLFQEDTLRHLGAVYLRLAHAAAHDLAHPLTALPWISEAEREMIFCRWNAPPRPLPGEGLASLFSAQVQQRPDATALSQGRSVLSYRELHQRSNRLARVLQKRGVGLGDLCAVCLERSFDLVIALLAIIKAGAAYVAIEPTYPPERILYMQTLSRARLMIARSATVAQDPAGERVDWATLETASAAESAADLAPLAGPDDLAYLCFTSGSTGSPKGVAVTQQGCIRLVIDTDYIEFGPQQVYLLHSPVSFDASTFELWASLLHGARLEILAPGPLDLRLMGATVATAGISTLFLTSALFHTMVEERLADLRHVTQFLTGGDVVSPDQARRFLRAYPTNRLLNVYGPTENTTFSTWHRICVEDFERASLPIGVPIANSTAYILDEEFRTVPPLFPGELFVGGAGVARGYVHDPVLTNKKFVTLQLGGQAQRLYRTGDRCRWLLDGAIEFLGRVDQQVKVDGHRIELGEVETALTALDGVAQAVVLVHQGTEHKSLVGFFIGSRDPQSARQELQNKLPAYLVPTQLRAVPAFPLSLHGKIDRAALLALLTQAPPAATTAPRDETEARLLALWQAALGLNGCSIHDDFFALGGKSLTAARLFARINREFGRDLPLATLVAAPTVAKLAGHLRAQDKETRTRIITVPFGLEKSTPPWLLVPGAGSDPLVFADLARALGSSRHAFGLQARGLEGCIHGGPITTDWASIPAVAEAMIVQIFAQQPQGPYFLAGHCFGAVLVWEIAHQLTAVGQPVGAVVLLDPIVSDQFSLDVMGGARWTYHWRRLRRAPWRHKPAYIVQRLGNLMRTVQVRDIIRPSQKLAQRIHASYTLPALAARVKVMLAQDSFYNLPDRYDPRRYFEHRVTGESVAYATIPGDHHTMLQGEGARQLATAMAQLCAAPAAANGG